VKILHALVKSSLVFVLVEGERLLSLIFINPPVGVMAGKMLHDTLLLIQVKNTAVIAHNCAKMLFCCVKHRTFAPSKQTNDIPKAG
jgi:hypothetical protein